MTIEMYQDVMNHLQIDKYRELIIEQDHKITELEKACEETQELLDKQIEATYKLDKENAELRKDKKELCHSISEGGKACVYLNEQLTKAKEIIKKLYTVYYDPCVTESDLKYRDELFAKIKQFLSEVPKWVNIPD